MADRRIGVGMPAALLLDQFGAYLWDAFGDHGPAYLVGSAIKGDKSAGTRDVDVRLLMDDEAYAAEGFGVPNQDEHRNAKWVATCLAWSTFGRAFTGLPIDFQIQQRSWANEHHKSENGDVRSALGLTPSRFKQPDPAADLNRRPPDFKAPPAAEEPTSAALSPAPKTAETGEARPKSARPPKRHRNRDRR